MEIKKDFFKNKKQDSITLDSILKGKTRVIFVNSCNKKHTCCVSFQTIYKKRHYEITEETTDSTVTLLSTTSEKKVLVYLETNDFILDENDVSETLKNIIPDIKEDSIEINMSIINDIIRYCEDMQVYDKLGKYNDFYYKLNKIKKDKLLDKINSKNIEYSYK